MSTKLLAINDPYILMLLDSPFYDVRADGTIFTRVSRQWITETWREAGYVHSGRYKQLTYKGKGLSFHRIIFQKFIGNLSDDLVINHKDGNGLNNVPTNLELVTQRENIIHGYEVLGTPISRGNKTIDFEIAKTMRRENELGLSRKDLAKKYGLCLSAVGRALSFQTWNDAEARIILKLPRKVNLAIAVCIRNERSAGATLAALMEKYGLSAASVSRIVNNKAWKATG